MAGTEWAGASTMREVLRDAFISAGYAVTELSISGFTIPPVVAEDPYSVVACVPTSDWANVRDRIDDMQVALGNWAIEHAPQKRWDLYLVILVGAVIQSDEVAPVEQVVSDIRYVRKIVRGAVLPTRDSVEEALAPFLPVTWTGPREVTDPMRELELELRAQGIDPSIVGAAVASFVRNGKVELP